MQNEIQQQANDEIGLKDIVDFIKRNKWLILSLTVIGLLISTVSIVRAPIKYEARWQLQMAHFINSTSTSSSISSSNSISSSTIEEPATLIQRLITPTAYPLDVQNICGVPEGAEFGDYLGGVLKIDVIKNVTNAVEMKVSASSPEHARRCAEAIIAMLVAHQSSLIEERLVGRQVQLVQYQQALREEMQQLERIKNSELSNFSYLSKLDRLSWLRTRIDALQEETSLSRLHPAKLLAPMYVPIKPVPQKVGLMLLLGGGLGLILGMLYALGREAWRRAA